MLNKRLKEEREKRNLSQSDLAEYLKISRNSVYNYETGERTPDVPTLIMYSNFFEVSVDYLLGKSDFKNFEEQKKFEDKFDSSISLKQKLDDADPKIRYISLKIIEECYSLINLLLEDKELKNCTNEDILKLEAYKNFERIDCIINNLHEILSDIIDTSEIIKYTGRYIDDAANYDEIKRQQNIKFMTNYFDKLKKYSTDFQDSKEYISKQLHEIYETTLNKLYEQLENEFKRHYGDE